MSRAFRSAQQQSSSIQSSIHRLPTCTEMGETAIEMCLVGNTPSFYSPAKRTTTESFYPTFSLSLYIIIIISPHRCSWPFLGSVPISKQSIEINGFRTLGARIIPPRVPFPRFAFRYTCGKKRERPGKGMQETRPHCGDSGAGITFWVTTAIEEEKKKKKKKKCF